MHNLSLSHFRLNDEMEVTMTKKWFEHSTLRMSEKLAAYGNDHKALAFGASRTLLMTQGGVHTISSDLESPP